jgi:hypothetical protein
MKISKEFGEESVQAQPEAQHKETRVTQAAIAAFFFSARFFPIRFRAALLQTPQHRLPPCAYF